LKRDCLTEPDVVLKVLTVLIGVLGEYPGKTSQSALLAETEADALLERMRQPLQTYLDASEPSATEEEEEGFQGPKLARILLKGREGLLQRVAAEAAKDSL